MVRGVALKYKSTIKENADFAQFRNKKTKIQRISTGTENKSKTYYAYRKIIFPQSVLVLE